MAALALCLLPSVGMAEGAAQRIACAATALCDAEGACDAGGADMAFTLTPVEVDEHGAGRYRIAYDGIETEAVMRPDMSLIWAEGRQDLQMLTLLDPTSAIWVRRSLLGSGGPASVTFVTCGEPR